MTEAEWLACPDPPPMLEFLLGKASDRKLRLFAHWCSDRVASFPVERSMQTVIALELADRHAPHMASMAAQWGARQARKAACQALIGQRGAKAPAARAPPATRHAHAPPPPET